MLPQGFQNKKLPDSAFTADTWADGNEPYHARLNNGSKWCPERAGRISNYNN